MELKSYKSQNFKYFSAFNSHPSPPHYPMLKPASQNLEESTVTQHCPSWVYDYMRFIFLFLLRLFVFSTHPKSFSLVASKSSPLSNPRTLNLSLIYTSKSQVIKGWVVFMAWRFVFEVWILLKEERP